MKQYLDAVKKILSEGTRKENRTGVDTISRFNVNYEIDLRDGFPLLTTKKVNWKNIVVENLWFLSSEPDIGILQKHGCKFWDAWADHDGKVPSAYGNFWRRFPVHAFDGNRITMPRSGELVERVGWNDQSAWLIGELKRNPMSRRLVVSAWAPGNAQTSKLPPCHAMFVLNVQKLKTVRPGFHGKDTIETEEPHLCLHLTQRSCDIALGVPYNIAGYALLLELFARFADLPAGIFAHTLVDAHAYTSKPDGSMADMDHVPGLREQLTREPRQLPKLIISPEIRELDDLNRIIKLDDTAEVMSHFKLKGYDPHPVIRFRVAV